MKLLISYDSCGIDGEFGSDPQTGPSHAPHPRRQMPGAHTRCHQTRKITIHSVSPRPEHLPHPSATTLRQTDARQTIRMMPPIAEPRPGLVPRSDQTQPTTRRRVQRVGVIPRITHKNPLAIKGFEVTENRATRRGFPVIYRLNPPSEKTVPLVNNHMELVALGEASRCPAVDRLGIVGAIGDGVGLAIGEQEPTLRQRDLDMFDDPVDVLDEIGITHSSAHGRLIREPSSPCLDGPVDAFGCPADGPVVKSRPENDGQYLLVGVHRVSQRPRWQGFDRCHDDFPKIAFHAVFSVQKRPSMDAILWFFNTEHAPNGA